MGMDVVGASPSKKCGEYFRANVWWWSPLWEYCETVAPEICEEVQFAYSNDGDGLDDEASKALATVLMKEIKEGNTKKYEDERNAYFASLPDNKCEWCHATGTRRWYENGTGGLLSDYEPLTEEQLKEFTIVTDKECNGCQGKGTVRPWASEYPFETEFVKEFATFLRYCGGFHIY
jgi:hypothetical protein